MSPTHLGGSLHSGSLLVEEGSGLLGELLLLLVLSLLAVDLLDQHTLRLVTVTLRQGVEVSVHVLVDLAGIAVLAEQSAQHTNAAHPEQLLGNTGVHGSMALTVASVVAAGLGLVTNVHTSTRVHQVVLLHDHSVLDHGANALARVGNGNVAHLAGIHPHLTLTALKNGGSKSLLKLQADHCFEEFYQKVTNQW